MGAYATDGKCHNSETADYNSECGKPAAWIGTNRNGWQCGFCHECKEAGAEARPMVKWTPIQEAQPPERVATTSPGYACKQCDGPAPVGIGYVDANKPRDESRTACDCGYSVKADAIDLFA